MISPSHSNQISQIILSNPPEKLPPLRYMKKVGSPTKESYLKVMAALTEDVCQMCKIKSNSNVLDLGSGAGRIAMGFSQVLNSSAQYHGIDVWKSGINWCKKNITGSHPNFIFHYIKPKNNYYFSWFKPKKPENVFRFEFLEDSTFDCVFAISLFTHLLEEDLMQYYREVHRVMKSDGFFYSTFFVIDDAAKAHIERTGDHKILLESEAKPGLWYAYRGQYFFAGFSPQRLQKIFSTIGFEVVESSPGTWAQKPNGRNYQDVYLLKKAQV